MAHFPSLNSTLTTAVASPTAVVARMCPSASPSSSCPSSSSSCSAASESVARSLCAWLCCSRCCDDDNSALDARRGDGRSRRPTNKANYEMANAWEKGRGSSRDGMANFREENNVASGAIFPETQQRRKHSPGVSSLTRHSGAGRKVSPTILTDPPPAAGAETGGEKSSPVRNLTPSTASIGGVNRSSDGKRNLGAMEALHKFAQDLCSAGVTTTTTTRRAKFHKHLLGDSQRKWHSLDSATERAERSSRSLPVSGRPSSQLSVQQQQQHLLRDMSPDQPTARISPIPEDAGGGGGGGPPRSQSGFNEILSECGGGGYSDQ
uniref:Uncharacterized protein n=1 Tax=Globodera pallida TaxID=36090 RepID=A0A183BLA3_GLOPA